RVWRRLRSDERVLHRDREPGVLQFRPGAIPRARPRRRDRCRREVAAARQASGAGRGTCKRVREVMTTWLRVPRVAPPARFATVIVVLICSAELGGQQPRGPDRLQPPALGPAPTLTVPAIDKRTLSNGLPIWIVRTHKVPLAQLELVVRAGSAEAPPVVADVVLRPTFAENELNRLREERLTALVQAEDDPEQLIEFAFPRIVYGAKHRYGTGAIGTAASLKGFTVDDLRRFHEAQYGPSNALLVVTGDVSADTLVPALEGAFGSWKAGTGAAAGVSEKPPQLTARRVFLID